MKSYTKHLKSTQEFGEKQNLLKKPILRSSAIFPVIQNDSYTRVMDCFKDEVKEPEFCQAFYKQYLE